MRIVVACFGNVLRSDDGFGTAVAERLVERTLPTGVAVIDVGIGGIHLVQELLEPTDALVLVDAVDLGRPPGSVVVLAPDVVDVAALSTTERHDQLADVHYATPARALMLARGLGVLPARTVLVGCQAVDASAVGMGLSPEVADGVEPTAGEVRRIVTELGVPWA